MSHSVKIVMVEDDHGHAKLIEKNIRRANIANDIVHFDHGDAALDYLFSDEVLGLAFVRNSVRRLGGVMELESELGQGSTFHLKFPTRLIVSGDAGDRL